MPNLANRCLRTIPIGPETSLPLFIFCNLPFTEIFVDQRLPFKFRVKLIGTIIALRSCIAVQNIIRFSKHETRRCRLKKVHPFVSTYGVEIILFLSGVFFFCFQIAKAPLWLDETFSAAVVGHGIFDLLRAVERDVHPPLYYLTLKAIVTVVGNNEFGLRLLSTLFALGLVALGPGPVRRIFGRTVGRIYMILVILSPGVLCFSQEARMYTMAAFFVSSAVLYGIVSVRERRRSDFVRFCVALVAGAYTHYFALLACAITALILLLYTFFKERSRLKPYLATLFAAALLYLPWVPSFLRQIHRVEAGFWIPKTDWFLIKFSLMAPFAYKYEDIQYPWSSTAALFISGGILIFALYKMRRNDLLRFPFRLTIGVHALTILLGIAISVAAVPIFMPRYLICCVGLFFTAVAAGICEIQKPVLRYSVLGVLLILALPADYAIQTQNFNGPFREVETHILKDGARTDLILHEDVQTLFPLKWRLPQNPHALISDAPSVETVTGDAYPKDTVSTLARIESAFNTHRPFWLVDFHLSKAIETDKIPVPVGWRITSRAQFAPPYAFTKITLTRWVPTEPQSVTVP